MPLYLKNHSYGEYVFDWAWANAYQRAGYHYYPKLLSAIPFSPVPEAVARGNSEQRARSFQSAAMTIINGKAGRGFRRSIAFFPQEYEAREMERGGHDVAAWGPVSLENRPEEVMKISRIFWKG